VRLPKLKGRNRFSNLTIKYLIPLLSVAAVTLGIYFLIVKWPEVKNFALRLKVFSDLLLTLLTAILVVITAFYAWITNRILVESKEARRANVRAMLWVSLDNPKFVDMERQSDMKMFELQANVINYGRAAAVSLRMEYSVHSHWVDEWREFVSISSKVERESIPLLLASGDSFDVDIRIPTSTYGKDYPGYLNFIIAYEDTDRNLYEMRQSYYLHSFARTIPTSDRHALLLETESLQFVPLDRRTFTSDVYKGISNEGITIFDRKFPWPPAKKK
jgi:hypothetical protein